MLKTFSLLLILAGLVLGPAYWIHVVHFTGQVARSVEMRAGEHGAWASPPFRLDPDMAPVGLVLRAAGPPIRLELGVTAIADSNPRFQERLLLLQRPQIGEYRLELIPEAAPTIHLSDVELDVHARVRHTDNRIVAASIATIALGALLLLM